MAPVEESFAEKAMRKTKEQPLVPIGVSFTASPSFETTVLFLMYCTPTLFKYTGAGHSWVFGVSDTTLATNEFAK